MAVLIWPEDLAPSEMEFWHEANSLVSRSPLSQAVQVQVRGPGRWRARLTFTDRNRAIAARLDALLATLDGPAGEIALFDFRRPVPRGTAASYTGGPLPLAWPEGLSWPPGLAWAGFTPPVSPRLIAAAARGDGTLRTAGWAAGETVLRAGDYLGLGGQLHVVAADVTSTAAGEADIAIRPRVRFAQPALTRLGLDKPRAVFRLSGAGVANPTRPGPFSTYTIELEESLPGPVDPVVPLPPEEVPPADVPLPLAGLGLNVERNAIVANYVGDGILRDGTADAIARHARWGRSFIFDLAEMGLRSGTTLLAPANLEANANFVRWMAGLTKLTARGRPVVVSMIPGQGSPDQDPVVFAPASLVPFWRNLAGYLAARFSPSEVVLSPFNETRSTDAAQVNGWNAAAYAAMREVAPDHWILLGHTRFNRIWELAEVVLPPNPRRLALSVHDYEIVPPALFPYANRNNFLAEQRARFAATGYTPPIVLAEFDPALRVEQAGPVHYAVDDPVRAQRALEIVNELAYEAFGWWAQTQGNDDLKAFRLLTPTSSPDQDWFPNLENVLAPGTHTISLSGLAGGQVTFPHSLAVTGTYTGRPSAIRVRVNNGAWQTLDAAPAGGTFAGTVEIASPGPAITISVDFANGNAVTASTTVNLSATTPPTGPTTSVSWSARSSAAVLANGSGAPAELLMAVPLHDHRADVDAQVTTADGAVSAWASRAGVAGAMSQAVAANQAAHSSSLDRVTFAATGATDTATGDWLFLNTTLTNRYAGDPDALGVVYMLAQITAPVSWTTWLFRLGVNNSIWTNRDRRAYHLGLFTATNRIIGIRGNDTTNNNATISALPNVDEWFAVAFVLNDSRASGVRNGASDQISRVLVKTKAGGTFASLTTAASAVTTQTASSWSNVEGTVGILRHNNSVTQTGVGNWRLHSFGFDAEPPITDSGLEAVLDQLLGRV